MAQLAEVVDGVGGVTGAAADAEDEQPSAALAHGGESARHRVDLGGIDRKRQLGRRGQVGRTVVSALHGRSLLRTASREESI